MRRTGEKLSRTVRGSHKRSNFVYWWLVCASVVLIYARLLPYQKRLRRVTVRDMVEVGTFLKKVRLFQRSNTSGGKKFLSKARLVIVEIHETPTGSTLGRVKEILTDAGFDCSEKTLSLEETLRIVPKNDPDVTWKSELKNKTQTWIVAERVS